MVLEFYYDLLSQPSRAIFILLKSSPEIKFKGIPIKLGEGEHRKPDYKKKNPFCTVPFIMDDGTPLAESAAILAHLSTKKGGERWFPKDAKKRARVNEFLHWQHSGIRKPCVEIFLETLRDKLTLGPFTQKPMDEAKVKAAKDSLTNSLAIMKDYFLKGKKFIGGDDVSAADILCVCEFYQLHAVGLDTLVRSDKTIASWMDLVIKAVKPAFDEAAASVLFVKGLFEKAKTDGQKKSATGPELYFDFLSQPSRAVYLMLKCAGVDFKQMPVNLAEKEQLKPEYKNKNRFCAVPFIMDDGFPLSESAAIMSYLSTTQPKAERWFPKDPKKKARVEEYLHFQHSGIRMPCVHIFLETLQDRTALGPFPKKDMDVEKVKAAKANLEKSLAHLTDYFLKDKKFIGGDEVSAADILAVCELYQLHGVALLDSLVRSNKKVATWMDQVIKSLQPEFDNAAASVLYVRKTYDEANGGQKKSGGTKK